MAKKQSIDKSRSRYGKYVTLRFHKPTKLYQLGWGRPHKPSDEPSLIAKFTETDGDYAIRLWETLETLCFENYEMKCALALDEVEWIGAQGKKIIIPPFEEFEEYELGEINKRE